MGEGRRLLALFLFLCVFLLGWLSGLSCQKSSSPKTEPPSPSPPEIGVQGSAPEKETVSQESPGGRSARLSSPLESELGLPFYPGSEDTKKSGWSKEGGYISVRTTRDSVEEVVRFYKSRLPHLDNEVVLPGSVTILAEHKGRKVFLLVTREGEITRIALNVSKGG